MPRFFACAGFAPFFLAVVLIHRARTGGRKLFAAVGTQISARVVRLSWLYGQRSFGLGNRRNGGAPTIVTPRGGLFCLPLLAAAVTAIFGVIAGTPRLMISYCCGANARMRTVCGSSVHIVSPAPLAARQESSATPFEKFLEIPAFVLRPKSALDFAPR